MLSYASTVKPAATPYFRPAYAPPVNRPNITDDYERWYTEASPNNRMLLSLRSGIDSEIGWALDRLCRLCDNEQFLLRAIPGLTDTLFEWPERYASETDDAGVENQSLLFAPSRASDRQRRHALESLFILRNAAVNEPNALELAGHPRTQPMIFKTLQNRRADLDTNIEFILHAIELLNAVASHVVLPAPSSQDDSSNPVFVLQRIADHSSNRTLIVAALTALTSVLSASAPNTAHLSTSSPALSAALRYLPLFADKPLVEACVNYLHVHLSRSAMTKAFLMHPDMSATLRLLVQLLLHEQVEETVSVDVGGEVQTVSVVSPNTKDHEISPEELDTLLEKPEPQRCYEWMKTMFVAKAEGELTQVDFWHLYKDVFSPHQEHFPLLVASDVIKNVNVVFPQAQAMVLQGPPQRFVVRGVDRRKDPIPDERFKCHWERAHCTAGIFDSPGALYEHLQEHINKNADTVCLWKTCSRKPANRPFLRAHVTTHLAGSQSLPLPPSQSDTITLPRGPYPYPTSTPTQRPFPPPGKTAVTFQRPSADPPSSCLTALLCIRALFRASFASMDTAPRADADHFGFPGVVEDGDDQGAEADADIDDAENAEREGERRGRRAFMVVRALMESVRLKDDVLMSWITEMVEAGMTGRS